MAKLKLGAIADDKPVKLTVELPADVHRDLAAYTDMLSGLDIAGRAANVFPLGYSWTGSLRRPRVEANHGADGGT
jgi:hypothetical protein